MNLEVTEDFEWDRPKDGEEPDFVVVECHRPPESEPDEQLRGNPMAMVFPPPLSDRKLGLQLRKLERHPHPLDWRTRSLAARLELLEGLRNFHIVFAADIEMANKCLSVARNTFKHRDPRNPRVMRAILELMEGRPSALERVNRTAGGGGLGMLLSGPSGVGKSSTKDRIVRHLGNYGRIHTSLNGRPAKWPQLGVVSINVASRWTDTMKRIVDDADRQRGIKMRAYKSSAKKGELERQVILALSSGFCPLLIIDEIQELAQLTPRLAKEILSGIVNLMEKYGIPVLLIGTVRVRLLFQQYGAAMSKFGGNREIAALRLGDPETTGFISELKRYAVSLTPIVYSDDFEQKLLAHTMGVRRFMVEYFYYVMWRHANDESTVADGDLLESIAQDEMKDYQPALSVLRKERLGMRLSPADYQLYEDRLVEADQRRAQTRAELRMEAEWRSRASAREDYLMTADDFLAAEQRKSEIEKDVTAEAEAAAQEAIAKAASAGGHGEAPPPKRGRGRPRKHSQPALEKAAAQLKAATKVVNLSAHRKDGPTPADGLDGSDIR